MKESVLDILIYLFENYMDAAEDHPQPDRESLKEELERAGFDETEVARALAWMDDSTPIAAATCCTSSTSASCRRRSASWSSTG
jgi:Smg protein